MGFTEIEAELPNLSLAELRTLALKSWSAYVRKEGAAVAAVECSEEEPELLASLDAAVADADATRGQGLTAADIRDRLTRWTSK